MCAVRVGLFVGAWLSSATKNYERLLKDGIPYFVVGLGGARLYGPAEVMDPDRQFFYNADHGALIAEACATQLTFQFRSLSEGTVDSFSIGSTPCGP